jgi:acetoin utilization protein AcuB
MTKNLHRHVIEDYMTPTPHTVGKAQPVSKAQELMREFQVRHLPVLDGGKLVGVVSDRDIKVAGSFRGDGDLAIEEVMTSDPYSVAAGTSLKQVLTEMVKHKYGCAVVEDGHRKVIGIFTDIDGLKALAEHLA